MRPIVRTVAVIATVSLMLEPDPPAWTRMLPVPPAETAWLIVTVPATVPRGRRHDRPADRCAHAAELDAVIGAWTRTVTAKEADAVMDAAEVPASRLYDIADCAQDPHFLARQAVLDVDDPLIGRTLHPGPAIRFDGEAAIIAR